MTIRGLALSMQCIFIVWFGWFAVISGPLQADVLMRQKKSLPYYMSNSTEDSENARIILVSLGPSNSFFSRLIVYLVEFQHEWQLQSRH
jgi:hypothetical protein